MTLIKTIIQNKNEDDGVSFAVLAKKYNLDKETVDILEMVDSAVKKSGKSYGYYKQAENLGIEDKWLEATRKISSISLRVYQEKHPNIGILSEK